jgi:nicotinate-nucleotide pyrophosphorylase (carboxylating)
VSAAGYGFGEAERRNVDLLIAQALEEDLGALGDITSIATIPEDAQGSALLVARSHGVLAGMPVLARLAEELALGRGYQPRRRDADALAAGDVIARLGGSMRALLALERTALNFLQRLSGIASLTARFVAATAGTPAAIYDTRKTTPGWRALEKYAVRCGGGCNHRLGLYDAVLIKDNHLAWLRAKKGAESADPIAAAIAAARANAPQQSTIEIEVDSLEELDQALACSPEIILLDNFTPEQVAEAVRRRSLRAPTVQLEVSGGVTLSSAAAFARSGVDRISIGALTHSAAALDLAIDFDCASSLDSFVAETPEALGNRS